MDITLDHTEHLNDTMTAFYFAPERRLRYMAGQFVELYLPHQPMDNRGDQRIFTLVTTPRESLIGIAAAFPENSSSFKKALRRLQPGSKLRIIGEPLGDFVLPKNSSIPLVWLAGGIASASFVGMSKELAKAPGPRHVTLFQSAKHSQELIFGDTWAQAGLTLRQTVTGTDQTWKGRHGRFNVRDLLAAANGQPEQTMFYISGSDEMVEACCQALMVHGIGREQLVREAYTGY